MSQKNQKRTFVRRIAWGRSTLVAQRPRRVQCVAPDPPGGKDRVIEGWGHAKDRAIVTDRARSRRHRCVAWDVTSEPGGGHTARQEARRATLKASASAVVFGCGCTIKYGAIRHIIRSDTHLLSCVARAALTTDASLRCSPTGHARSHDEAAVGWATLKAWRAMGAMDRRAADAPWPLLWCCCSLWLAWFDLRKAKLERSENIYYLIKNKNGKLII